MAVLSHITLNLTATAIGAGGTPLSWRARIADSTLPTRQADHDAVRLLLHALSRAQTPLVEPRRRGFTYTFPLTLG